jgi:hypothetical protein
MHAFLLPELSIIALACFVSLVVVLLVAIHLAGRLHRAQRSTQAQSRNDGLTRRYG